MKIWKNGTATDYNIASQVDSITFEISVSSLSNISSSSEVISSSINNSSNSNQEILTDSRDNQTYSTVTIGTQTWMAENLNYGAYLTDNNTDSLYQSGAQKFCYDNNTANCDAEGGLYQWHTAMDFAKECSSTSCSSQINVGNHQGIWPNGWHMPKQAEWDALQTYLGGSSVAGKTMKLNNTGNASWDASTNNDGNSSGSSALPSGARLDYGGFNNRGSGAYFWEAVEDYSSYAHSRYIHKVLTNLYRNDYSKRYGFSVRCAQD